VRVWQSWNGKSNRTQTYLSFPMTTNEQYEAGKLAVVSLEWWWCDSRPAYAGVRETTE